MAAPPTPKKKKDVRVRLNMGSKKFTGKFDVKTSIWDMLCFFEVQNKVALTSSSDPMGTWYIPIITAGTQTCDNVFRLCHNFKQLRVSSKDGVVLSVRFGQADFDIAELPGRLEAAREQVLVEFPLPVAKKNKNIKNNTISSRYPDLDLDSTTNQADASREFQQKIGGASRRLYEFLSAIPSAEEWGTAKKTTRAILRNLKKPEDKFQKINKNHKTMQQRLMRFKGAEEFFLSVGFVENMEGYLVFQLELSNPDEIGLFIDRLIRELEVSNYTLPAEPIREIPLSLKVWTKEMLRQAKSEYSARMAATKIKSEGAALGEAYRSLKAKREYLHPTQLMTQKHRKQKAGIVERKYGSSMVHVEFPSGLVLEGHFHPTTKLNIIRDFIYQYLNPAAQPFPFQLSVPPNRILKDENLTLKQAQMVPTAYIRFKGDPALSQACGHLKTVLSEDLLESINQGPYEPVPQAINKSAVTQNRSKKKKNALASKLLGKR